MRRTVNELIMFFVSLSMFLVTLTIVSGWCNRYREAYEYLGRRIARSSEVSAQYPEDLS